MCASGSDLAPAEVSAPAPFILVYTAAVYLLFLAVFGYAIGFFAGFGVPKGIDQGPRTAVPVAVAIDLLLLLLFAVQHTVMARPWFKRCWMRKRPRARRRPVLKGSRRSRGSAATARTATLAPGSWPGRNSPVRQALARCAPAGRTPSAAALPAAQARIGAEIPVNSQQAAAAKSPGPTG